MAEFLRRHSLLLTAFFLFGLSLQLTSLSIQNRALPQIGGRAMSALLSPLEKVHHEASESVRYVWRHYVWLLGVESERNELLDRIKALEAQNSRLIEFEGENGRLRTLLNFSQETGHAGIAATIIGRDPSNWVKTVTIDRGAEQGIKAGMPVVDGHAIVGQIIVANDQTSKVLLLTDNVHAIDALIQGNRAPGIAEGRFGKKLRLSFVLKEYAINPGERVIASGLDQVFPKGSLIGVVTSVNAKHRGMFQEVEIEPSVDLNRLENVLVLTHLAPVSDEAAGLPPLPKPEPTVTKAKPK